MTRRYIIYCDESDSKGRFYSHFYGGVLIEASKQKALHDELQSVKDRLHIFAGEMKWQRVTEPYVEKYIDFVNAVFDIISRGDMKMRIMFTQNRHIPFLDEYQEENEYFLLYYQFIKHAFGLRYAASEGNGASAAVLLDDIPHNREKLDQFRTYISSLSAYPIWRRADFSISHDDITDVNSKDHNILQALDVVLGGIQSRLNEKHTKPVPPARRRTKRARAKARVYQAIKERIFQLYPNFNVGITTGQPGGPRDRFDQVYRHWLFVPNEAELDETRTKKAAGIRK
ncbi:DUF3800 domain-containing protein [Croceibacterium sp. LX-88]|uniref:DUF3800 domain-containing protein n=1 Tax=Croceibacterium selenioxidans TaxID=2838833 RepID=A0ABS5W8L1_9SPHN|nr:DUF3800 domain-containing protein [Croceibacterium selenioxidans]MBT2135540.1 DUF3800 domain-containing protein [Croceibacterium selenioxidans]